MEFYSVSAQIIVVLLLALTIESHLFDSKRQSKKDLPTAILEFNQVVVYTWAVPALMICLLRLSGFTFWNMAGGKLTVLGSVAILLSYLAFAAIMARTHNKLARYSATTLSFFMLMLLLPVILEYVPYFDPKDLDLVLLTLIQSLITVSLVVFLFFNKKKNLKRLQNWIGLGKLS